MRTHIDGRLLCTVNGVILLFLLVIVKMVDKVIVAVENFHYYKNPLYNYLLPGLSLQLDNILEPYV